MIHDDFIVPDLDQKPVAPKPIKIPRTPLEHLQARQRAIEATMRSEKEIVAFATKRKEPSKEMAEESEKRQRALINEAESVSIGIAALQSQSELLDALEEITFPDRVSISASLMRQEIDALDLLVKHGRAKKTPSGTFEWVSK